MIWVWIAGVAVLGAGAVVPPVLLRARGRRADYVEARDRAHAAMSLLEVALDNRRAKGKADYEKLEAATRDYTLAGAALAGPDTVEGFRQAEEWANKGLARLRVKRD